MIADPQPKPTAETLPKLNQAGPGRPGPCPNPFLTIATSTLPWRAADGVSSGASTQARPDHTVHLLFHLWVSRCTAPKSRSLALSPCTCGDRYRQHRSVQESWELTPHPCMGPREITELASGLFPLTCTDEAAPPLTQSCRQDRQPSRHPCLRGRRAGTEHSGNDSTSTKQCEDKGKPTLGVSVNIH